MALAVEILRPRRSTRWSWLVRSGYRARGDRRGGDRPATPSPRAGCTIYSLPDDRRAPLRRGHPRVHRAPRPAASSQSHPLAGTIALPPNVAPEDYQNVAARLHQEPPRTRVPVDDIVRPSRACTTTSSPTPSPSIVALRTVAHLGTWVTGVAPRRSRRARRPRGSTPLAPHGRRRRIPRERRPNARRLEQIDRGHYAGPARLDGRQRRRRMVARVSRRPHRGTAFEAWAGAGIVSESDPIAEREETRETRQRADRRCWWTGSSGALPKGRSNAHLVTSHRASTTIARTSWTRPVAIGEGDRHLDDRRAAESRAICHLDLEAVAVGGDRVVADLVERVARIDPVAGRRVVDAQAEHHRRVLVATAAQHSRGIDQFGMCPPVT